MKAVCQGPACLLTLGMVFGFAGVAFGAGSPLREGPPDAPRVEVVPIPDGDFAAIRNLDPELAACIVLSGAGHAEKQSAVHSPEAPAFVTALQRLILAVTHQPPSALRVFYGFAQQPAATAFAFGYTVLLLLPTVEPTPPADAARSVVTAWLLAHKTPAFPEEGVSEPLLRLGESLAWLGSLALANTPPDLLPLGQWVEPKAVAPALEQLVRQSLDTNEPYRLRRARLKELTVPGRASPELAQAAAFLVETFGDPDEARRHPMALLRAWAENRGKRFPFPPRLLRSALAQPARAGLPKRMADEDAQALALDEGLRAAWARPAAQPLPPGAPGEAEGVWRARRRAQGLPTPAPRVRPGEGFCLARPEPPGFAVTWRGADGEELLLLWPRWVLAPQLGAGGEEVVFVDPEGIWRVSLIGEGAELVQAGTFRALAASPSGRFLAALAWPDGEVRLWPGAKALGAASAFCWLQEEVLVVGDGQELRLVSVEGQRGAGPPLPCHRALAGKGGRIVAAVGPPCQPALVSADPGGGEVVPLLQLPEPAADLVAVGEGWVFSGGDGVFLLSGGSVKRLDRAFSLGGG